MPGCRLLGSLPSLLVASVFFTCCLLTTDAFGTEREFCEGTQVSVHFTKSCDFVIACQALNKLTERIAQFSLRTSIETKVVFTDQVTYQNLSDSSPTNIHGACDMEKDLILVSSWNTGDFTNRNRKVLGLNIDKILYESVVIHELTHAVVNLNASISLSPAAHEFWAYVLQIDLLPESYKKRILNSTPAPFSSRDEIHSLHHAMSPNSFGIKAYRWYSTHGEHIMMDMLTGKFLPDEIIDQLLD